MVRDERQSLEELRNTVVNLLNALVEQGVITREKAAQMVKAAQDKAAADAALVAKGDEGAVRVPYVPQIVKDEIAKEVAKEVKPDVVADVLKDAKTQAWGVPGALPEWITRTRISGDVTLREEGIFYDKNNAQGPTSIITPSIRPAANRKRARTPSWIPLRIARGLAGACISGSIQTSPTPLLPAFDWRPAIHPISSPSRRR